MLIFWMQKLRSCTRRYVVGGKPSLILNLFVQYYISVHQFIIILSPILTAPVIMKMQEDLQLLYLCIFMITGAVNLGLSMMIN